MKTGSKNVVMIEKSINNIELLTDQFKKKRLTEEEYIRRVNKNLANLTNERDYIEYLTNIGQY